MTLAAVQCNLRHGSELVSPWHYVFPGQGATAICGERRQLPHTGQREHQRDVRTMSAVSSSSGAVRTMSALSSSSGAVRTMSALSSSSRALRTMSTVRTVVPVGPYALFLL